MAIAPKTSYTFTVKDMIVPEVSQAFWLVSPQPFSLRNQSSPVAVAPQTEYQNITFCRVDPG